MIRSYKFIETDHQNLHNNIIAFFERIEFEIGEFDSSFFDNDFYNNIVIHHPKILEQSLKEVFEYLRDNFSQEERTTFINKIKLSCNIQRICNREDIPIYLENIDKKIKELIKKFAKDLYVQILNGKHVKSVYGSLQEHFEKLKGLNPVFKCPTCGLSPAKSSAEKKDDYDHYLPKSLFPFSSVNFKNLVPICTDCNSSDVKGDEDILTINNNRKLFYPYDESHKGISVFCHVINDVLDTNENNLEFTFTFSTEDNRVEEIESWKTIYKIDDRYKRRAKGKGKNWYHHYWEFMNDPTFKNIDNESKKRSYLKRENKNTDNEFIKLPVIEAIEKTTFLKASTEAKKYSMNF